MSGESVGCIWCVEIDSKKLYTSDIIQYSQRKAGFSWHNTVYMFRLPNTCGPFPQTATRETAMPRNISKPIMRKVRGQFIVNQKGHLHATQA